MCVLVEKLRNEVQFQYILDDIRNSGINEEGLQGIHLLERQDMYNISIRDFNIGYATKQHTNDAVSVKLWVKKCKHLMKNVQCYFTKNRAKKMIVKFS